MSVFVMILIGFGEIVGLILFVDLFAGILDDEFIFSRLFKRHIDWKSHKTNFPYLSFEEFEKYYWLNPDSWVLSDYSVGKYLRNKYDRIEIDGVWERLGNGLLHYTHSDCLSYQFSFSDYKKYLKFVNHLKDLKEQEKLEKQKFTNQQQYIRLLEEVQKDIDALKEQAADEWKQGVEMVEKALKNIE